MSFFSQKSWFESNSRDKTSDLDISQDLFTTQDLNRSFVKENLANESSMFWSQSQFSADHNEEISETSPFFEPHHTQDSQFRKRHSDDTNIEPSQFFKTQKYLNHQSSQFLTTQQNVQRTQSSSDRSQFLRTQHTSLNSQPSEHGVEESFQSRDHRQGTSLNVFNDERQEMNVVATPDDKTPNINSFNSTSGTQAKSQDYQATQTGFLSQDNNEINNDSDVPTSIKQLRERLTDRSDWTFMSIVAGQLCKDSFPMNSYHNLKLSLLMSIASINSKSRSPPIPIVAVGQETSHANIIMNFVGRFAERFVTSAFNSFEGLSINSDGHIEAGPLVLSKDGVLFIGDWSGLPPKTVSKLLREIETGQVTTEKIQQTIPLESSIWAYWSCSTKIKKDISSVNQFMSVFGIPIMLDDFNNDMDILDDLLNQTDHSDDFHIPDDEIRNYLRHVARQHVTMDPEAETMLKEYFAATRIVRQSSLTPKAFEILQQMAESHAKLCLRNIVTSNDVLVVINISEKHIRVLFDKDSYSSPEEPKFTSLDDIDIYYKELLNWHLWFTKNVLERGI